MESSLAFLGVYAPKNVSELFGSGAFILHLAGYYIYAKGVLTAQIRANVATWLMWLFGGVVEFLTYDNIAGAHWSTSALPFACLIGIGCICAAIFVAQLRNGHDVVYHRPERNDYFLAGFDIVAATVWLSGGGAAIANMIAVSTSIVQFIPLWKTTYHQPASERATPWVIWCLAYLMMTLAVVTGKGSGEIGLYFYPIYYLALHLVVVVLALKK
jgi:hypothetical protein